jgi:hypothetical protein
MTKKNGKGSAAQQTEPAQGTEAAAEEKAQGQGTESAEAAAAEAAADAPAAEAATAEQQQPVPDEIETTEGTEFLKITLSVGEKLELGDELVRLYAEKETLEDRFADMKSQMKAEIDEVDTKIATRIGTLRDNGRFDNVPIKVIKNWRLGTFEKVRTDTGEVYGTRPLTGEERQQKLFKERAAEVAKKKKEAAEEKKAAKEEAKGEEAAAKDGEQGNASGVERPAEV